MKFSLSIVILFVSLSCFGQQLSSNDSIFWDKSYHKKLTFQFENPSLVRLQQYEYNIGEAELSFKKKQGDYKRAKSAYTQSIIDFEANGLSQVDKFIISGNFKFNKIWEDSLANTLQGVDDDISPFYYFVQKAGKYERQNFKGNVQVRYAGFNNLFQPGINFDYATHWTTRSVDPRPSVGSVAIKINPFVTAQLGRHQASIGILYGYGDEDSNIGYKNRDYNTSMLYPDRIYYTNQGFGFISQKDTATMRKYDQYIGANFNYSIKNQSFEMYTSTNIEQKVTNSTYDQKLRQRYKKRSEFTLKNFNHQTLLELKESEHVNHLLDFTVNYQKGVDFNYNLNSANYIAEHYKLGLGYFYTSNLWNIGLDGNINSMEKTDAAADHYHSYSQANINLHFCNIWDLGKNKLETTLIPNYTWKISNTLNVPSTQVNVFTTSTVYPDYDYFNMNTLGLHINLSYFIPSNKKLRGMEIFTKNQILSVLENTNKNTLSLQKGKYNLWQSQLGLKFYL